MKTTENIVKVTPTDLYNLIETKLTKAGLKRDYASEVAKHLVYADSRGIHSHGAIRVEYYAEQLVKGGANKEPNFTFEKKGPSIGVFHGQNASGQVVAHEAMKEAIKLAKETGIGFVGISKLGHSGALGYYVENAAKEGMIAISLGHTDALAIPPGGIEPMLGANPFAFAAPTIGEPIVVDMATTVQAWGKVLDARAKNEIIPDTWAVDVNGNPTTDPHAVKSLLPMAGAKGYSLMIMIDVLSGPLLGLPFGKHISPMYASLTKGRDLGQIHIVIDPSHFTDKDKFVQDVTQMVKELNESKPAEGVEQVYVPGQLARKRQEMYAKDGIPIAKEIYDYLASDVVHSNRYDKTVIM